LLNVERRHHSMRRVLNYTWQRLPPAEQSVLATLSVFRGGFTRQAAQTLAMQPSAMQAPATQASPVAEARKFISLRLLRNLVYKSLLHYSATRDRYENHELLRRFAADKLAQDANYEMAVRQRHSATYCAALQARQANLKGSQQQVALAEIEADVENVRVAWRWAVEQGDVPQIASTLEALFHFYDMRSWFQEGEQVFREAALCLAALPPSREQAVTLARLQARAGWFAFHLGQQHESVRLFQESLSQLQQQGAEAESVFNLNYLGAVMRHLGEYERADTYLSEALRLARQYEDRYQASITLNVLGQTSSLRGDYESARYYCREGLRLKRAIGDHRGMTYSLSYLGRVARALGEYEEAQRLFEESMHISETLGDQRGVAFALQNLADTAQALGRHEKAEKLYHQALAIFRHIGNPLGASICLIHLAEVATARSEMAAARRHLREGLQMALESGSTPNLLAGLLAMAGFWLRSGHPEHGLACLAFVQNYPESTLALQKQAQQLERQHATMVAAPSPGGLDTLPANGNLASFVEEWLLTLS
ncbi:MAG TPA: tetratricopeptide repeat protein, partial [Anaerolineae bacterium]